MELATKPSMLQHMFDAVSNLAVFVDVVCGIGFSISVGKKVGGFLL